MRFWFLVCGFSLFDKPGAPEEKRGIPFAPILAKK